MTTYDFIAANKRRSVLLIVIFTVFVIFLGWTLDQYYGQGGSLFLTIAVIYALASALFGYYSGDQVALWSSGAVEVDEHLEPRLVRTIQNLAITTGLPMPRVYVIEDQPINAFATGRDPKHASVAVTRGALQRLSDVELEGVLAHELSHVRNYDIRVMTLVIVLVGVVSLMAQFFWRASFFGGRSREREGNGNVLVIIGAILMILSPIVAMLIQLAVSRRREYLADSSAALITRYPEGLASALRKIQQENLPMEHASSATSHLYIANPFNGKTFANLLSTHPPIDDRIAALMKMANVHE